MINNTRTAYFTNQPQDKKVFDENYIADNKENLLNQSHGTSNSRVTTHGHSRQTKAREPFAVRNQNKPSVKKQAELPRHFTPLLPSSPIADPFLPLNNDVLLGTAGVTPERAHNCARHPVHGCLAAAYALGWDTSPEDVKQCLSDMESEDELRGLQCTLEPSELVLVEEEPSSTMGGMMPTKPKRGAVNPLGSQLSWPHL
eukprot:NODE_2825_length_860_cov_31.955610_g2337_i0.p1 GENE.NODE_2825_length_860_cov_31.955610_g2337_i0~~NODE_2825_length_860_cov_31.955610_g2337_i0.p1  ORF type:complete len:200 (+),score=26.75 NODE_2825_length_860_cov_31.955610_g2337_i0:51-650(+)